MSGNVLVKNSRVLGCYKHDSQLLFDQEAFFLLIEKHHVNLGERKVRNILRQLGFISFSGYFNFKNLKDLDWYAFQNGEIGRVHSRDGEHTISFALTLFSWENLSYLLEIIGAYLAEEKEV
jgi:hypothetical protein